MTVRTATVLVVDDEPELCANLQDLIAEWGYQVHTAPNAAVAMAIARQVRPDVTITDLSMPGLSGIALLGLLKELDPAMEVIILTGQGTMETAIAALREGRAFDFLKKPLLDLQQLQLTIERALARRNRQIAPAVSAPVSSPSTPNGPNEKLSAREHEILVLLAQGLETRELATRLGLSEKTVRNHLSHIYQKLGAGNRLQAVMIGQQTGLL